MKVKITIHDIPVPRQVPAPSQAASLGLRGAALGLVKRYGARAIPYVGTAYLIYEWLHGLNHPIEVDTRYWTNTRTCEAPTGHSHFKFANSEACGATVYSITADIGTGNNLYYGNPEELTSISSFTQRNFHAFSGNYTRTRIAKVWQKKAGAPSPTRVRRPYGYAFAPHEWPTEIPFPMPEPNPNTPPRWPLPAFWPDDPAFPDPDVEPGTEPQPHWEPTPRPRPGPSFEPISPRPPRKVEVEFEPDVPPAPDTDPDPSTRPRPRPRPDPGEDRPPLPDPTTRPRPRPRPGTGPSPRPRPRPRPRPAPSPGTGPRPRPVPSPNPTPVPVVVRPPGPPPYPKPPGPGRKEGKFNYSGAVVVRVLDAISEAGEFVDCAYRAMPGVSSRAAKRKSYSDAMRDMWDAYKAQGMASKSKAEKAKFFEANRPKWDDDWKDPIGPRPKTPISQRIDPGRPYQAIKYLYDHFDEITPDVIGKAIQCSAINHIEDHFLGSGFGAKSDVMSGRTASRL